MRTVQSARDFFNELLDIDTKPHYTDETRPAPGTTVLWKYRAIYLKGDQVFGQWSDVVSIAVAG